jgi:hypothetical protein
MPKNVPKTDYVVQSNEGFLRGLIAGHAIKDATHVLTHIGGLARGDYTDREGDQAAEGRKWAAGVLTDTEATK